MKKIIYPLMVVGFIIIVSIIFLISKIDDGSSTQEGPIHVGVMLPLSGDFASVSEGYMKGIQSVNPENVAFIYEDSACDPAKAVTAFKKLTDVDNVQFVIGPACGSPQEAIAPFVKEQDMLVLLPVAASAKLYEQSDEKMFQLQYSLEDESKFIAEHMNEVGYNNVVLLTYANAYSQTHSDSFKKHFSGNIEELKIIDFNSDINTEVLRISEIQPDAIYSPDLSFFLGDGLEKLDQYDVDIPVYSVYTAQFPPVRTFVEGVTYSYPGDLGNQEGAEYGLGKQAAELFVIAIDACSDDVTCVHEKLLASDIFNDNGISKRNIILKKIVDGKPVVLG